MSEALDVLSEFDELVDDVTTSSHEFFSGNLRQWFAFLDRTPRISYVIGRLESVVDFGA